MSDPKIIPIATQERMESQLNALKDYKKRKLEKRGRKTVIDDECVLLLIAGFQSGLDARTACRYAGIGKTAFYQRYNSDEDFADTIDLARDDLKISSASRISSIIKTGDERTAGPLAWKVFETQMPELYGRGIGAATDKTNNQQNNIFVMNNEQVTNLLTNQPDVASSDPTELLEALEEQHRVEQGAEIQSATPIHSAEIQPNDSNSSNLL